MFLDVYYKAGEETSQVFEDAQDGYDYIKGRYSLRNFKLLGKEKVLIIQQFKSGKYITPYETLKIKFHGLPFKISKIQVDNEEMLFKDAKLNGDNTIVISKDFTEHQIIA